MQMTDRAKAARSAATYGDTPGPLRRLCREATSLFIVHGHRLTSLYRRVIKPPIGFIVLKIHKKLRLRRASESVYLWNNEAGVTP